MTTVELREVTGETVRDICRLKTTPEQEAFVAPNAVSIAEAYFEPKAWFRAIYTDGAPVGFVMPTTRGRYYLWRLLIDDRHQRRGHGQAALELVVAEVLTRPGATELTVSWVPADGGPGPFYLGLGFVLNGEVDDGEVVALLPLVGQEAPDWVRRIAERA
jgi:diamine N-acetyltransferase